MSALDSKLNQELLTRMGWYYYSPFDVWRVDESLQELSGEFVRGEYDFPLTPGQFRSFVEDEYLSLPDGRIFEVGNFKP